MLQREVTSRLFLRVSELKNSFTCHKEVHGTHCYDTKHQNCGHFHVYLAFAVLN